MSLPTSVNLMFPGVPKSCLLDDSVCEGHTEEIAAMVAPLGDRERKYPEEESKAEKKKKQTGHGQIQEIGGRRRTVETKQ